MATFFVGVDRDNTLVNDAGYLGKDSDWKRTLTFCSYALEGLRLLKADSRIKVVVATNQAGIARGHYGEDRAREVNQYIDFLLKSEGLNLDGVHFCPYVDRHYAVEKNLAPDNPWVIEPCEFRKPGIGMLQQAAADLGMTLDQFDRIYFVGDKKTDVETGLNAGGTGILIKKSEKESNAVQQLALNHPGRVFWAENFQHAAEIIINDIKNSPE
ncbi:HAD-IIIA family hydrolase [Candidatus Woesearchaeota archaeon]|nr:HAD-IIIA family hydrolase [Candidatus Woesearchaeota archaeon]